MTPAPADTWSVHGPCNQRDGIWWPVRALSEDVSYPREGHRAIAEVEDASFWFRHRNRAIARLVLASGVCGPLWDVGAGTGVVAAHLQRSGIATVAVEPGATGARIAVDRGVETVVCGTLEQVGLPPASIAAVGLFDVVEHLADPVRLLGEVARVLVPGGRLFVSVPAYRWLWSHADEEAGHFRRYTVRRLDREVSPHGFRRTSARYLFHSLVIPVAFGRALRTALGRDRHGDTSLVVTQAELAPSSRLVSVAVDAVLAAEYALDPLLPLPFGTSILARYERIRTERASPIRDDADVVVD